MDTIFELIKSWKEKDGINSLKDILSWVDKRNKSLVVNIKKTSLEKTKGWYLDETSGRIRNDAGSFFSISGFKIYKDENKVIEQPIIIQNEIGYLGIICKQINGVLHFLMQAKIEPGNINKIQISPTIQATKSNFEQKHGGAKPAYLDYFLNSEKHHIIVDQLQSEQAERFFKKRNRNTIILLEENEEIEVLPSHKWMTLGQIKELMKIDNLVNMDTRTVLSCIPFVIGTDKDSYEPLFKDKYLYNSIYNDNKLDLPKVFTKLNNFKMFSEVRTDFDKLTNLKNWHFENDEFTCKTPFNFKLVFCDLEIEGREVKKWSQPLFEATGIAMFSLLMAKFDKEYKFLARISPESGSFDKAELGPTIQKEFIDQKNMPENEVEQVFVNYYQNKKNVKTDVLLSEEGGRFYHEQNRNIILEIDKDDIKNLPENYIWVDYKTINYLIQFNNVVNIQLRNLISLLEM